MPVLAPTPPTAMSLYLSGGSLKEASTARDSINSVLRRELPDVVATAALLTGWAALGLIAVVAVAALAAFPLVGVAAGCPVP